MEGYLARRRSIFKDALTVYANPHSTVTASCSRATYTETADASGVAVFSLKRKGTYQVTSGENPTGRAVSASKSGLSLSVDITAVSGLSGFTPESWSTGTACLYWTLLGSLSAGVLVKRAEGAYPTLSSGTEVYRGVGSSLALSASVSVTGCLDAGLTPGTTYYYRAWSYYVLRGTTYYSDPISATYTAQSFSGAVIKRTATGAFYVPAGWRTMSLAVIGGGASGGGGAGTPLGSDGTWEYDGGGGGGAGRVTILSSLSVVPGSRLYAVIGAGGVAVPAGVNHEGYFGPNGNSGEASSLFWDSAAGAAIASAAGGNAGGKGYSDGNGGAGGSGGGAGGYWYYGNASRTVSGGAGGTNGGNGADAICMGPLGVVYEAYGGTGQGSTTIFNGVSYAAGGTGGYGERGYAAEGADGTDGTGNGGGGGWWLGRSGKGGSGAVVLLCTS